MNTWINDADARIGNLEKGLDALQQMVQGLVERIEKVGVVAEPAVKVLPQHQKWRQMVNEQQERMAAPGTAEAHKDPLAVLLAETEHIRRCSVSDMPLEPDCLARIAAVAEIRARGWDGDEDADLDPAKAEIPPADGYSVLFLLWILFRESYPSADDWLALGNAAAAWLNLALRRICEVHEWVNYGTGDPTRCRVCNIVHLVEERS